MAKQQNTERKKLMMMPEKNKVVMIVLKISVILCRAALFIYGLVGVVALVWFAGQIYWRDALPLIGITIPALSFSLLPISLYRRKSLGGLYFILAVVGGIAAIITVVEMVLDGAYRLSPTIENAILLGLFAYMLLAYRLTADSTLNKSLIDRKRVD